MTVRDFMNYLVYIEHSAENLQFFLWFRDYQQRFENAQTSDVALAQEWTQAMEDDAIAKVRKINAEKMKPEPKAAEIFKGTDFEKQGKDMPLQDMYSPNPFNTPPRTPYSATDVDSMYAPSSAVSSAATTACQVSTAFANAGVRQPCKSIASDTPPKHF
jgi:hypothetical protein